MFQDGTYRGHKQPIEPFTVQDAVEKNLWQDWDCLQGIWWVNNNPDIDPFSYPSAPFYKLRTFSMEHPDARLVYSSSTGGDAIRLSAGGPFADAATLVCYADNFTIGKGETSVTYRFEYREQCPNRVADLLNKYKIYIITLIILIPAALLFIRRRNSV